MKISIVIPAYNEEKFISNCLESIRKQSKEVEVIVVDNASTDATASVVSKFPDVKLVYEPKKGLTHARQAGLVASTGELIAQIDADSLIPEGWISKVTQEFERDPNLIGLSGPVVFYDLSRLYNFLTLSYYFLAYLSYLVNRFILKRASLVQGSNFVVKREALEKIGGYNTNIKFYGEDTDLAVRIQALGPVKFTLNLKVLTSARRLKSEGVFTVGKTYAQNYFSIIYKSKPYSENYADIRNMPMYLTFDDGPNEHTQAILDLLDRHNVQATFFVIGKNVLQYPDILREIHSRGHTIGIHSYSHNFWNNFRFKVVKEAVQTRELIYQTIGIRTDLYRSPWGITMPWVSKALQAKGFKIWHWNIMATDWWQITSPKFIARHVARRSYPKAVVLLHDHPTTVKALDMLLRKLGQHGYSCEALLADSIFVPSKTKTLTVDNAAWLVHERVWLATLTLILSLIAFSKPFGAKAYNEVNETRGDIKQYVVAKRANMSVRINHLRHGKNRTTV